VSRSESGPKTDSWLPRGGGTSSANVSFHPANAFDPLFVTDTGSGAGVLVPNTIVRNGVVISPGNSGLANSALGGVLTTCTFQSTSGAIFVVTGILAPTTP
jgi:hypothetical protein